MSLEPSARRLVMWNWSRSEPEDAEAVRDLDVAVREREPRPGGVAEAVLPRAGRLDEGGADTELVEVLETARVDAGEHQHVVRAEHRETDRVVRCRRAR